MESSTQALCKVSPPSEICLLIISQRGGVTLMTCPTRRLFSKVAYPARSRMFLHQILPTRSGFGLGFSHAIEIDLHVERARPSNPVGQKWSASPRARAETL